MSNKPSCTDQAELLKQLLIQWQNAVLNNESISLFLLNIDNYKRLENKAKNFTAVFQAVQANFKRDTDYLTCFNRKQILILASELTFQQSNQIAEKLHNAVAKLEIIHPHSPNTRYLTISIGHTTYSPLPDDDYGVLDMLMTACSHLSTAKLNGGNCSETVLHSRVLNPRENFS